MYGPGTDTSGGNFVPHRHFVLARSLTLFESFHHTNTFSQWGIELAEESTRRKTYLPTYLHDADQ